MNGNDCFSLWNISLCKASHQIVIQKLDGVKQLMGSNIIVHSPCSHTLYFCCDCPIDYLVSFGFIANVFSFSRNSLGKLLMLSILQLYWDQMKISRKTTKSIQKVSFPYMLCLIPLYRHFLSLYIYIYASGKLKQVALIIFMNFKVLLSKKKKKSILISCQTPQL